MQKGTAGNLQYNCHIWCHRLSYCKSKGAEELKKKKIQICELFQNSGKCPLWLMTATGPGNNCLCALSSCLGFDGSQCKKWVPRTGEIINNLASVLYALAVVNILKQWQTTSDSFRLCLDYALEMRWLCLGLYTSVMHWIVPSSLLRFSLCLLFVS